MQTFLLTFIPLFVAIDVFGVLPTFSALTERLEERQRAQVALKSCFVSLIVGGLFVVFGNAVFIFLGITQFDFMVGGGILLFLISVSDILGANLEGRRVEGDELAIVPLAMPLILGPASITTLILISSQFSKCWALSSLVINIFLVYVAFLLSSRIQKFLGKGTNLAIGKIASLFLMAIAVMMVRKGIYGILGIVS
ncbi:MAG: MarC family protein [Bdellovibrio sp.]|nr:MarC family protein [Bdellovibrio sp.]